MARPAGYEATRHPTWEIVSILDDKLGGVLVPEAYDYIAYTWTGNNVTQIVYKTGGAGGTTVATLTLAYTGNKVDSITKT